MQEINIDYKYQYVFKEVFMKGEKILQRKICRLNELKRNLLSRDNEDKGDTIDKIKDIVEEVEIILEDFEYIKNDEKVQRTEYKSYNSFKESQKA